MSQGRSDTPSLLERLRANTVAGKDREELLIEYGKLLGIGAPKPLVDAILRWNDLMAEAVVELERLAASETVPRIHPTPEMMEAGIQTVLRTEGEKADERARRIYRAMVNAAPPTEKVAPIAPPTREEIAAYRDLFRAELDKRMDTNHPSASPSTEAHSIALHNFVEKRNARR